MNIHYDNKEYAYDHESILLIILEHAANNAILLIMIYLPTKHGSTSYNNNIDMGQSIIHTRDQ